MAHTRTHFEDIPDKLYKKIRDEPIMFVAYRVLMIRFYGGALSESDEIPFIKTPIYSIGLLFYIVYKRLKYLIGHQLHRSTSNEAASQPDHLIVVGTSSNYRTYSLTAIARKLNTDGENVRVLYSPAAESRREEWESEGLNTVAHTELHGRVSITRFILYLFRAISITRVAQELLPHTTNTSDAIISYNYVLTEFVKTESVRSLTEGNPRVYTYSPMPYLVKNTKKDRIFVFQHGIQWKSGYELMAAPFYVPLTYFIWSDVWAESFEDATHPDSEIVPVGSPWHDHLAGSQRETQPEFDVLLISQSHGIQTDEQHKLYEEFVRTVVELCEREKLELRIKLHPKESKKWYTEHGLKSYINTFDDIDTALQQTRIAVTDISSAFVESSVYGTPIVVADIRDQQLSSLAPVQNVLFPETLDDLPSAVRNALNGDLPQTGNSVVETGGSIERIISATRTERGRDCS